MAIYPDFIESTGYGDILGLGGVNCRHSFFGVTESMPPSYTPEQLADMHEKANATREWKNQRGEIERLTPYDATQRMRRMENAMRKTRHSRYLHFLLQKLQYRRTF